MDEHGKSRPCILCEAAEQYRRTGGGGGGGKGAGRGEHGANRDGSDPPAAPAVAVAGVVVFEDRARRATATGHTRRGRPRSSSQGHDTRPGPSNRRQGPPLPPLGPTAAGPATTALCCSSLTAGEATLAGSGIRSSSTPQARTAQMTSRSSTLMLAGCPDDRPDIFPALTTRPRSARSRWHSLAFQIPRLAAASRRFHLTAPAPSVGQQHVAGRPSRRLRYGCGARGCSPGSWRSTHARGLLDSDQVHAVEIQLAGGEVSKHRRRDPIRPLRQVLGDGGTPSGILKIDHMAAPTPTGTKTGRSSPKRRPPTPQQGNEHQGHFVLGPSGGWASTKPWPGWRWLRSMVEPRPIFTDAGPYPADPCPGKPRSNPW